MKRLVLIILVLLGNYAWSMQISNDTKFSAFIRAVYIKFEYIGNPSKDLRQKFENQMNVFFGSGMGYALEDETNPSEVFDIYKIIEQAMQHGSTQEMSKFFREHAVIDSVIIDRIIMKTENSTKTIRQIMTEINIGSHNLNTGGIEEMINVDSQNSLDVKAAETLCVIVTGYCREFDLGMAVKTQSVTSDIIKHNIVPYLHREHILLRGKKKFSLTMSDRDNKHTLKIE
ncbi:MAG: hypothetical protein HRT87_00540 [Legionellales bacterium]|nr:hypothetical protein [Legionellales bacterium]